MVPRFAGPAILPFVAGAVLLLSGCGGSDSTPPSDAAVSEPTTTEDLERVAHTQPVVTPDGIDEVYDEIFRAVDEAYADLGSPPSKFDQLGRVQDLASKTLSGGSVDWPPGTSYSLSVLDDRVAVYINRDGEERKGDWVPGQGADRPI